MGRWLRLPFRIPVSVKSGVLVCEVWSIRPDYRLRSNRVVYQANDTFTYIVTVGVLDSEAETVPSRAHLVGDFLQRSREVLGVRFPFEFVFHVIF